MKKFFLFSLPILFLFGLFIFNPLDSYAYTLGKSDINYTVSRNDISAFTSYHIFLQPRANLVVWKDGIGYKCCPEEYFRSSVPSYSSYGLKSIITDSDFTASIGNESIVELGPSNVYAGLGGSSNLSFSFDCPVFVDYLSASQYILHNIYDPSFFDPSQPTPSTPVGTVTGSEDIPAPHVHWGQKEVTYNNKKYKVYNKSLYFDNYVYDNANHGKWYLELHYAWSTVRGGSMGKGDANSFRYYYDDTDIIFQTTQNSEYIKPQGGTFQDELVKCPGVIHFNTGEFLTSFNSFLSANPISSSLFEYSLGQTPLASLFWNSDNLATVDFAFNCPLVVCRYYRLNDNGSVNYGPWTSTSLAMPDTGCYCYLITDEQGQRLGIFNSKAYTNSEDQPDPGGTTPGLDPKPGKPDPSDIPIPDPDPSDDVNLSDLVDSLDGIFDFLKSVPNFFRVLFSFLPSWVTDLLAVCIALAIIIGLVKLVF